MSPQKVRLVLDTIRGKRVGEALAILRFLPHKATVPVAKVIQSASANAENNFNLDPDELVVTRCYADEARDAEALPPTRSRPCQSDLEAIEPRDRRGQRAGGVMGQKVHPIGFRLGVNVGNRHVKEWQGKWYADKDYTKFLHEDLNVRELIMNRLAEAGVSRVDIERSANQMTVTIHAAKPGIVIGKSGVKVEELRRDAGRR